MERANRTLRGGPEGEPELPLSDYGLWALLDRVRARDLDALEELHHRYQESLLFERAQAGDPDALEELFRRCQERAKQAVRRRLREDARMQRHFDSMDIDGDAWKDLATRGDLLAFDSPEALTSYLQEISERNVIDEYRRRTTLKWDMRRRASLDGGEEDAGLWALHQSLSHQPSPGQNAQAEVMKEYLMELTDIEKGTLSEKWMRHYFDGVIVGAPLFDEVIVGATLKVQRFFQKLRKYWDSWAGHTFWRFVHRHRLAEEARQRAVARHGWPHYLSEVGAKVVDRRHNDIEATRETLFRLPDRSKVLACACPSTGRVHFLAVPPRIRTCARAQAWLSGGLSGRIISAA